MPLPFWVIDPFEHVAIVTELPVYVGLLHFIVGVVGLIEHDFEAVAA